MTDIKTIRKGEGYDDFLFPIEGSELRRKLDLVKPLEFFIDEKTKNYILACSNGNSVTFVSESLLKKIIIKNIHLNEEALVKKYATYLFHKDIPNDIMESYDFKADDVDISYYRDGFNDDSVDFFADETLTILDMLNIEYGGGERPFFVELSDEIYNIALPILQKRIDRYLGSGKISLDTIAEYIEANRNIIKKKDNTDA